MALSSGTPPSAIAVVRASGPDARRLAEAFGATDLIPRRASLRTLTSPVDGGMLDRALCLWFPYGASATGEDCLEFHCHGSPALIERVLADAITLDGVRLAEPGEFTMRAVLAGRMDLTDAEALAELIDARTESQRRRAANLASGALSRAIARWRGQLIGCLAEAEARLDFADEGDVPHESVDLPARCRSLAGEMSSALRASEGADRLTEGLQVAIVGPPNAGKSSLLNALVGTDAAIVMDEAGTTRDIISVAMELNGYRVVLHDTAGVREGAGGVEAIGIQRALARAASADIIVEVTSPDTVPLRMAGAAIVVAHKRDIANGTRPEPGSLPTRIDDAASIGALREALSRHASDALGQSEAALITRARQRSALSDVVEEVGAAASETALELVAERLRLASHAMARMTGEIGVEDILDEVFGRFCIGK